MKTILTIIKSEWFADFLVRWWPAIESRLTARGLGRIAQRLTFTYKHIKEGEFEFTGIPDEPDPIEVRERAVAGNIEVASLSKVWPKISSYVKKNLIVINQGSIGSCALHTVQNLVMPHFREQQVIPIPVDVSLLIRNYRWTKKPGDDLGTIVSDMLKLLPTHGLPIQVLKLITTKEELLKLDMDAETAAKAAANRLYLIDPNFKQLTGSTLDELITDLDGLDTKQFKVQISLDVYRHKKSQYSYWNNWIVKWASGMYKTGRHSVAMLFMTIDGVRVGVMQEEKERGILVLDSGDGSVKFICESYLKNADFGYRIIRLRQPSEMWTKPGVVPVIEEPEPVKPVPIVPTPNPVVVQDPLAVYDIKYEEKSDNVRALQKFLNAGGFLGNSGVNGKYGSATAKAVQKWLLSNNVPEKSGKLWGPICREIYKRIKK